MPNQIRSTGKLEFMLPNDNNNIPAASINFFEYLDCIGTAYQSGNQTVPTGSVSVTALATSSLSTVGMMGFQNLGSGSIEIASDSAFTKRLTVIGISGSAKIPWSSSIANCPLFARCTNAISSSLLYAVREL